MQELTEGVVLAGRYELVSCVARAGDHWQWHATDRTLNRDVTAITFPADDPHAEAALDSARRAAGVDDQHLLRILDVGTEDDMSYVVTERLHDAESVADLLQFQTLPPEEVRRIVGEAAAGLHTAAARGLHHLCLTPHDIVRARDGAVTVLGVATDSALTGRDDIPAEEASRTDTEDLVRILYTALTGRWPGSNAVPDLPKATVDDHHKPVAPASVVTRVPSDLNTVCTQVLGEDAGPRTPGDLARLLSPWSAERVHGAGGRDLDAVGDHEKPPPASRVAPSAAHYFEDDPGSDGRDPDETQFHQASAVPLGSRPRDPSDIDLEPPAPYLPSGLEEPDRRTSGLALAIVVILLVLTVVAAFYGLRGIGGGSSPTAAKTPSTSTSASGPTSPSPSSPSSTRSTQPAGTAITPVSATGFDPQGNGNEHNELASLVIDGNNSTMWVTHIYQSAQFGGIKKGAGLILDLGKKQQVGSVAINVVGSPTTLQVFVTDTKSITGATPFGILNNGSGDQTVRGTATNGRYVIVWITSLSQYRTNGYRDQIAQVKVTS